MGENNLREESAQYLADPESVASAASGGWIDYIFHWRLIKVKYRGQNHINEAAYTEKFNPKIGYVSIITRNLGCHILFVEKDNPPAEPQIRASLEDIYVPPGYWHTFKIEPGKFRLEALLLRRDRNEVPFLQVCERY